VTVVEPHLSVGNFRLSLTKSKYVVVVVAAVLALSSSWQLRRLTHKASGRDGMHVFKEVDAPSWGVHAPALEVRDERAPPHRSAKLLQRLNELLGSNQAVHREAIKHILDLRETLNRTERFRNQRHAPGVLLLCGQRGA